MAAKIIGIVHSCRECPNRRYYSGGVYECMKADARLPADCVIPSWCPLANYPTQSDAAGEQRG